MTFLKEAIFHCLLWLLASVLGSVSDSSVEIILSEEGPIRIGSNLTIYCAAVNSSQNIEWYKSVSGRVPITNSNATQIERKFLETGRYSVRQLEVGVRPVALEITNIQKADEGTIGCYLEENFAEVTFEVLGAVTEVFVDIRPYGSREVSYTTPGDSVLFALPQPRYGYTARCHVQATTPNVTVVMKLAGNEIPGQMTGWDVDPITSDPLQERVYVTHKQIQNFKPGNSLNQERLECIATSPNYPLVEFRNHVILNVHHKPVGECSVLQPSDYTGTMTVRCDVKYNPTFMYINWKLVSTDQRFNGYQDQTDNVTTYYATNGLYDATFFLLLQCSESMPEEDTITVEIANWSGTMRANVRIRKPPAPVPTTTFSSTTLQVENTTKTNISSSHPITGDNLPVLSSGDQDDESSSTEISNSETLSPLTRPITTENSKGDKPDAPYHHVHIEKTTPAAKPQPVADSSQGSAAVIQSSLWTLSVTLILLYYHAK